MVLRGQGAQQGNHDCHWVRVGWEAVQHGGCAVSNGNFSFDFFNKSCFLLVTGQFAVQQQVAGFQMVRMLCQLVYRIATVQQRTRATINIGDG